jgi:RHS repeat-associated protein
MLSGDVLDTIFSPFGDTVTWKVDSLWRPIGPHVQSGPTPFSITQVFDSTRKLLQVIDSQGTDYVGLMEVDQILPDVDFLPTWSDRTGSMSDSLGHDGWARVTKVVYQGPGGGLTERFGFDEEGNITLGGEIGGRTYNGLGQLAARGSHVYRYDRAGNLISDSTGTSDKWIYTYDPLDRLIAARHNDTLVARYAYDVLGRRIAKRVYAAGPYGATTGYTRMIYGGSHVVAEADSGGTLTLGYTWGMGVDNLVAIHKYGAGSGDWYAIQDRLHNVRGLTKRDGTWTASWRYRIYGAVQAESLAAGGLPFPVRYRWTGREFDQELGWYFMRSRHYDPTAFRFVQEDPSGFEGGLNLYMYGDGDPTTGRDPDGMTMSKTYNDCPVTNSGRGGGFGSVGVDWSMIDGIAADHDATLKALEAQRAVESGEGLNDLGAGGEDATRERARDEGSISYDSPMTETMVKAAASVSTTLRNAIAEMDSDPSVWISISQIPGSTGFANPGLTEDLGLIGGRHIILVTFDFGQLHWLNSAPFLTGGNGTTVDDVVDHELYVHAYTMYRGRNCDDTEACAVMRENVIRRESGRPPRLW